MLVVGCIRVEIVMTPSVFPGEIEPDDLENAGDFASENRLPMLDCACNLCHTVSFYNTACALISSVRWSCYDCIDGFPSALSRCNLLVSCEDLTSSIAPVDLNILIYNHLLHMACGSDIQYPILQTRYMNAFDTIFL